MGCCGLLAREPGVEEDRGPRTKAGGEAEGWGPRAKAGFEG